ncbi:MAG: 50S ribosomal protein L22 [Candidatus Paceibacterota bacterium]|jgi:large subunit ribosomal protein L22
MTTITAKLNNYRQSPRKVRLVADLIKGKPVNLAIAELDFLAKRASAPIKKLLMSAVANAKNSQNLSAENLKVKGVTVDAGVILKRIMPRARGSASGINKRTSHITLVLSELENNQTPKTKKQIKSKGNS